MKIENLYKYFLYTQASHLPVWEEENHALLGLLPKERILMELADLSLADREFSRIPEEYLVREIPETLLAFFQKQRTIPVLSPLGERKEDWDKPRLLAELSRSSWVAKEPEKKESNDPESPEEKSKQTQWFMEVLLQNFPDGLLATDLDGHSVFYNETFENEILPRKWFKDSILHAEKLLKEMSKELLGNYLKTHELRLEEGKLSVQTFLPDLDCLVRVSILHQKGKPVGYLYHFSPASSKVNHQDADGFIFPSVAEAFRQKLPLETILKEVEGSYIYQSLKRNQENVSHAALDLGVPRTTLQNRIKFLDLTSKFPMNRDQPIPRRKSPKEQESVSAASSVPKNVPDKKPKKKTSDGKSKPKARGLREKSPVRKKSGSSKKKVSAKKKAK
ncbi:transcriptional regulator [Leptospira perolatii]|uniref:Transcriptional regulator n=1 Tax=Leptospira perolatii TaxID=2023191 RepID=A0A2M9ZJY6_9LEPT|nr:helix-turn-helix domain-containing protein [Leptospira perolatii]PJZ69249.1 transcriptional regulator [Leptospira perolatii]PJZ72369.1 transcriptional regulator [Leptospira perolatii]